MSFLTKFIIINYMVATVKAPPRAPGTGKADDTSDSAPPNAVPEEGATELAHKAMQAGIQMLAQNTADEVAAGTLWTYQTVAERSESGGGSGKVVIDTTQYLISDGKIPTHTLKVDNPLYRTRPKDSTRRYEGYRLIDLLKEVPNLENIKTIMIRAEDHFVTKFEDIHYNPKTESLTARVGNERVDIGQGFVAIRDLDAKEAKDGSDLWDELPPDIKEGKEVPRGTKQNRTPGPAWLVFPNDHPLHNQTIYWPYQARTIELIPR